MSTVFIISAPSGSGKSTLVHRLLASDKKLLFSISCTTRAPRGTERDGEAYQFITREEFEGRVARGEMLEWAVYGGDYYGTGVDEMKRAEAAGADLVLDIEVQGARQLKAKLGEDVASVFLLPPSREALELRLRARRENSETDIQKRLATAMREIPECSSYDYVVVNDEVESAVGVLRSIIAAERARSRRMRGRIAPIVNSFAV